MVRLDHAPGYASSRDRRDRSERQPTGLRRSPLTLGGTPGQLPGAIVRSAYAIDIVAKMDRLALSRHEDIVRSATDAGDSVILDRAGPILSCATVDGLPATISQDDTVRTATLRCRIRSPTW